MLLNALVSASAITQCVMMTDDGSQQHACWHLSKL